MKLIFCNFKKVEGVDDLVLMLMQQCAGIAATGRVEWVHER